MAKPTTTKTNPPARRAKPKAVKAPAPAPAPVEATPEVPQELTGHDAHFHRGWTDFNNGQDNRGEYRGNPAKLKDKDAYISGQTHAKNYAKLQSGSASGGNLA